MCGIAGYIQSEDRRHARSLLRSMCDRLVRRGPDGHGEYFDGPAALGHRRLSIIDLSTGDQPMGNEDGSLQVVFNGEIYNYRELREQLVQQGHRFSTHSDTEVLVHLYEEKGERAPEYLNGMFAFAIWDSRRQSLFLARDRMGKKPIYYTTALPGLAFCFASELKALTAVPGFNGTWNDESVADFLSLSYVPEPKSIYRDVSKLPAGCSLLVSGSGLRIRRYWTPSFNVDHDRRFDDVVEEIRTLAADAVERRMLSDVPLGAFLSGGVDSSGVVAFMARKSPASVKTFSIGFTSREYDELEHARAVVTRYRTDHREFVVTPSVHEMLDVLQEYFDEPFGDSSALPTLYLSRMTREHVTVALNGDGADEVFGGYRRYRYAVLEERLREKFPGWFRQSVIRTGARWYPKADFLPQVFRAKTLLTNLTEEIGSAYFNTMSAFREDALARALSPRLQRSTDGYSPRADMLQRFQRYRELEPLAQLQAVDYETYLPGDILVKADRATMAYSLEGRSPWLDYRLVELAGKLPSAFKLSGKSGKHVFKEALAPHIPRETIVRPKMGFSVPVAEWFRGSLKKAFEAVALREEMADLISLREVRRLWNEHQSRISNHEQKLWNLFMLASWQARHAGSSNDQEALRVARA